MKKLVSIIAALIMIAASVAIVTSCNTTTIESITVVGAKVSFVVGDTIDYDSIMVEVKYSDGSTVTKSVKNLGATVDPKADLTKAGKSSYTVNYQGKSFKVNITVAVAGPETEKEVSKIEILNPKTIYKVGDTIDYDSLSIKVTYADNTEETKTVKELKAIVSPKADLSKAGSTSYTISYGNKSDTVNITVQGEDEEPAMVVSFYAPDFWTEYKAKSKARTATDKESEGDFRVTEAVYEVGNVNKFIFRPTAGAFVGDDEQILTNVKTTAKVYKKNTAEGQYAELTGNDLTSFVTINDNTYKFGAAAANKFVKLEISIDEDEYDVDIESEADKTLVVEFKVIDGGYNAYDQLGFSVMADLEKRIWSEMWKCDVLLPGATYTEGTETKTVGDNEVKLKARADSVKLEADDKPLCEYVDNIDTVIVHWAGEKDATTGNFKSKELDLDQLPSAYFWKSTDDLYTETRSSLAAFGEYQNKLVGSLRDGSNSGATDGEAGDRNYMRVLDVRDETNTSTNTTYRGGHAIELNIGQNMQKAIFATKKVSVSGNYHSLVTPARGVRSKGDRVLESYADYTNDSAESDPQSHWAMFLMYQPRINDAPISHFEIRNFALTGNNPQFDDQTQGAFHPAGLMLCINYAASMTFKNVITSSFFTNAVGDNYGDITKKTNEDKFHDGSNDVATTAIHSQLTIDSSKFYDAYSNMIFVWRSNASVIGSEMKRSGGPLFIMSDDEHKFGENYSDEEKQQIATNTATLTDSTSDQAAKGQAQQALLGSLTKEVDDKGGCSLDIDNKSVLEAYATGNESWYTIWNAGVLFNAINSMIEPTMHTVNKTFLYKKNNLDYINVIAAMICSPSHIMNGNNPDNVMDLLAPRGVFTQYGDNDGNGQPTVLNQFALNNELLRTIRAAGIMTAPTKPASQFAPIIQSGINSLTGGGCFAMSVPSGNDMILALPNSQTMQPEPVSDEVKALWAQKSTDKACLYMSAGSIPNSLAGFAPYFGVVVDLYNYTAPQA